MSEHGTASGILFKSDGKILLLQRGNGGDFPGHWAFPGGHIEPGETAEQAARREVYEEAGFLYEAPLAKIAVSSDGYFTTFGAILPGQFAAVLNDESSGWGWYDPDLLPQPMHPGTLAVLESDAYKRFGLDELEIGKLMAAGELSSPQRVGNMCLWALRITGTGTAYRSKDDEIAYRPPENYLNDEFLARCNGLPVIFEHPEGGTGIDSKEFADRAVGTIMLPYISGEEVWGIARIYDDATNVLMDNKQMSTSPSVIFYKIDGNKEFKLDDGTSLLIEGTPSRLDHLAICEQGVWDKGHAPAGVKSDNLELNMADPTEVNKDDAEMPAWAKGIADSVNALSARMDSLEGKGPEDKKDDDDDTSKKDDDNVDMPADPIPPANDSDKKDDDDDEEEKKRDDSTRRLVAGMAKEIASLKALLPRALSDADRDEIARAQVRADSLAGAFGEKASPPIAGESPLAYRRRLAQQFQPKSANYKGADLSTLTGANFDMIENLIYNDAQAASVHALDIPAATLVEVHTTDQTGRRITSFKGDPEVWTSQFKIPGRRALLGRQTH